MPDRFAAASGSTLTLGGALTIGAVLHAALVEGTLGLFSPLSVFGLLGGTLLVIVGHRIEERAAATDDGEDPAETNDEGRSGETTYDPEMAPIEESALAEKYERDDDYER